MRLRTLRDRADLHGTTSVVGRAGSEIAKSVRRKETATSCRSERARRHGEDAARAALHPGTRRGV